MINLNETDAFVWDFDGTLFDTYPFTMDCIQSAVRTLGGEVDRTELYGWLMQSIPYAHEKIRERFGYGDEYIELYTHNRGTDFRREGAPFEKAEVLLRVICESGCRNYMFTHRVHDVWDFLRYYGFEPYFTRVLTLADGVEPKPSPQAIELLCREYRLDKSRTVSLTGVIRTRLKRRLFGTFPLFDFDGRQPACNLKVGNLLKNPFFSGRRVSAERICR